jgi:hypothetical protein
MNDHDPTSWYVPVSGRRPPQSIGFDLARRLASLAGFQPSHSKVLDMHDSQILTFEDICVFFLILPPFLRADKISSNNRRMGFTRATTIRCDACQDPGDYPHLEQNPEPQDPDLFPPDLEEDTDESERKHGNNEQSCELFELYLRKGQIAFSIILKKCCLHCAPFWRDAGCTHRKHRYEVDRAYHIGPGITIEDVASRQPLRKVGKELLRKDRFVDTAHFLFFKQVAYVKSGRRRIEALERHSSGFDEFVDNLPGFRKVRVSEEPLGTKYLYRGMDVLGLTWLPRCVLRIYQISQHSQLDASFRASKPFCYSVPQAIVRNVAVPLGMIVTPTETEQTYQWFFEDLEEFANEMSPEVAIERKPILSDQGTALEAFCTRNQCRHYYCHRHLIEKFGASGFIGMLVARALREQSKECFDRHLPDLLNEAEALLHRERISLKEYETFVSFVVDGKDFQHGMWHRIADGVSTCSNHAERFHGVVNHHLCASRQFVKRLSIIVTQIEQKIAQYGIGPTNPKSLKTDPNFRQLDQVLKALREHRARQVD